MQSQEILKKRAKETEKKKRKPSLYDSILFRNLPRPKTNNEKKFNLMNQKIIDEIICGDSREMSEIENSVVSLIITSPPYNVGAEYSNYQDDLGLEGYLDYLDGTWEECLRVLRPGGRLCINVAGIGRQPFLPLHSFITKHIINLGFFMRGDVIWNKGASGISTAWGSWLSSSNPALRDVHEHILIFSKYTNKLKPSIPDHSSDIIKEEFLEYTKSIWSFNPESSKRIGHPTPFPEELPYRLIKLYSFPGDLIVDPFCGSGTTCVVAKKTNRQYIGYDIDPSYVELSKSRLANL